MILGKCQETGRALVLRRGKGDDPSDYRIVSLVPVSGKNGHADTVGS